MALAGTSRGEGPPDPQRILGALSRHQVSIDLATIDLCFLAALYLRAERESLASFDEDTLLDQFEQTCDLVEPGAENPRKRATHAIQRLREQRMLARVDGVGIVQTGEYTLTRLAAAVVAYFIADETLTRESLTLLTHTLSAQLAQILNAARRAENEEDWRSKVVAPLRVTVGDLIGGIERRQRGLDAQQEEVQAEIAGLLSADWFGAIDRCQALLETTARTLRELNEVLMRDAQQFVALLQDMQRWAARAEQTEAEAAIQRVIEQVDRIAAWGGARQRGWSEYYQYVHRYLRDVVRLDPDRALSQRLRDQISGWLERPFTLWVAHTPAIAVLRAPEVRGERPTVSRPRAERDEEPARVADDAGAVVDLDDLVRAAIAAGHRTLVDITAAVLAAYPTAAHYAVTGRVADAVARLAPVQRSREHPWVSVTPTLHIEDWALR